MFSPFTTVEIKPVSLVQHQGVLAEHTSSGISRTETFPHLFQLVAVPSFPCLCLDTGMTVQCLSAVYVSNFYVPLSYKDPCGCI